MIATTWRGEPLPAQIFPGNIALNISTGNFTLYGPAVQRLSPFPSSLLTDLNAYPPSGTSGTDEKGYFSVNMQLSDCIPTAPCDPGFPTVPTFTLPANPNTFTLDNTIRVFGFAFNTAINRVIKKVGIYAQTTTDHSIGVWDFSVTPPLLLWQKQISLSDPYILDQGFRWYDAPDILLQGVPEYSPGYMDYGSRYVIATTWSGPDPIPAQLNSTVGNPTVGIPSFSLNNTARIISGNPLPSSHLTDLNAFTPTGTSGFDNKGYYTVNMQLSDCIPIDPCAPAGAGPALSFYPVPSVAGNTRAISSNIRVYGYHFTTSVDRTLRSVGIYNVTTKDHTVGVWDFSVTPPLLLWQKQIPKSEPYIPIEAFRWYAAPELHLLANRDYVIATTWGQSESAPAQLTPSQFLLNLSGFNIGNSAEITWTGYDLLSSFLTDLTAFAPTGTSNFDNKGYFTANMQLTNCAPQPLYSFINAPPTIMVGPGGPYDYQVYGFELEREVDSTVKEVGIWSASTSDHTVGIWDITTVTTPSLIWQRQIPANEPYYYFNKSYRWYNVSNGPKLLANRTYVVAVTWAGVSGGLPCQSPPSNLNLIPNSKLGNTKATSETNPVTLPLLTNLSNPLYYPTDYIGGDDKGYYGVNLSLF